MIRNLASIRNFTIPTRELKLLLLPKSALQNWSFIVKGSHIRDILADSFRRTRPFTSYKLFRFIVGTPITMPFPDRRKFIFHYYHFTTIRVRTAKLNTFITGMIKFHYAGFMFAFFRCSRTIKRHYSQYPVSSGIFTIKSGLLYRRALKNSQASSFSAKCDLKNCPSLVSYLTTHVIFFTVLNIFLDYVFCMLYLQYKQQNIFYIAVFHPLYHIVFPSFKPVFTPYKDFISFASVESSRTLPCSNVNLHFEHRA